MPDGSVPGACEFEVPVARWVAPNELPNLLETPPVLMAVQPVRTDGDLFFARKETQRLEDAKAPRGEKETSSGGRLSSLPLCALAPLRLCVDCPCPEGNAKARRRQGAKRRVEDFIPLSSVPPLRLGVSAPLRYFLATGTFSLQFRALALAPLR